MSLRLQLLGTFALVLLGTLIIAAWLTYRHALNKIDTEMAAAIAVGSRIAHNAVDDVEEVVNPRRRLELLVADFDGDRHLEAFIVEPGGKIAVRSKIAAEERDVPAWFTGMLAWRSEPVILPLPSVFEGVGRFGLKADPGNEIGETWSDIQLFAKILSFFCAAGVLITLHILGSALKPLHLLTNAFHRIGAGDYEPRMSTAGSREFAELAVGFNHMAGKLSEMEAHNSRLVAHLETVQEEERAELARNLHDEVSPLLFCVDVDAMSIRRLAEGNDQERIREHAFAIQNAVDELKINVKSILGELRPTSLHALALRDSIDDLVHFWSTRHPSVDFEADVPSGCWGAKWDDAIISIVRESVSNALKHSTPTKIRIDARESGGRIVVRVEDNGGGLKKPVNGGGFGILGMKERANRLGGRLSVGPTADHSGVAVVAEIPVSGTGKAAPAEHGRSENLEQCAS